MQDETEVVV